MLGVFSSAARIDRPGLKAETIGLLADSTTPDALATIGDILARERESARAGWQSVTRASVARRTVAKLVDSPHHSNAPGYRYGHLGERFGANHASVASVILTSTVLGFITFNTIAAMALA